MSLRFLVTRHDNLPGVRLSLRGHWGNIPHECEVDALAEIARVAGNRPHAIERESFPALAPYRGGLPGG